MCFFQVSGNDAWVAALVATVRLLALMLKHVYFEVFGHLEGVIALNTWVRLVFGLNFHVLSSEYVDLSTRQQSWGRTEQNRNYFRSGSVFGKWKWCNDDWKSANIKIIILIIIMTDLGGPHWQLRNHQNPPRPRRYSPMSPSSGTSSSSSSSALLLKDFNINTYSDFWNVWLWCFYMRPTYQT